MNPTVHDMTLQEMSALQVHDLMRLRVDVFVVEQECPYPELDGRDAEPATRHLWIERDGDVAATLRVLDDGDAWRIGRVATHRAHRGAGLAARLMEAALSTVSDRAVVLDAQSHLEGWYARFGFAQAGSEFIEDGIPHIPMRRESAA